MECTPAYKRRCLHRGSSKQNYMDSVEDLVRSGQGSFMHVGTVSQRVYMYLLVKRHLSLKVARKLMNN